MLFFTDFTSFTFFASITALSASALLLAVPLSVTTPLVVSTLILVALTSLSFACSALILVVIRASGLPPSLEADALPPALVLVEAVRSFGCSLGGVLFFGVGSPAAAVLVLLLLLGFSVATLSGMTWISFFTELTPCVFLAISSARSASAWVRALPFTVTMPPEVSTL